MSVDAPPRESSVTNGTANGLGSYENIPRRNSLDVRRPQMTSQNGVITINGDSNIPRSVSLRRAKSLTNGRRDSRPRRYSVVDLEDPSNNINCYDARVDVSNLNGRSSSCVAKKPPVSYRIPEDAEEDEVDSTVVKKAREGLFNTVTLKRNLSESFRKVRGLGGRRDSDPDREKNWSRNTSGTFVQFQDELGDWQRHSIRRGSKFEPYDFTFKVMLIGDSCVGKTCLLTRFKDGKFLSGSFISTVGIDFRNKVVTVDGSKVKLQIWDTAGQERFRSVTHAYYRDAHALLLLYDVTSKNSFDNTRAWLAEVHEYAQDDVVIMLIGNKCDVNGDRVVRREDGERLAREYNVAFMETSAKTGLNVDLAFMAVARELKARKSTNPSDRKFNVADYVRQEARGESCNCNVG
ncbi:ras-related protein Rab-26-like [Macrobrachium nipponense]|uniref:ras-related protein Rab-26-like n=1 Tax=Macrobrachium nipponense TaxID=159736 RepID=UPI0030C81B8F